MKWICLYLALLGSAMAAPLFAAQDAAIEAKEGDVEHWIEYYKKERGLSNETVTEDKVMPEVAPRDAGDSGVSTSPTRPATPDSAR
ncbi:MAG: hypothetical protein JSU95_19670 [Betaproteobacteria bacterium]|nr:MAG: hypothetical protein JSU95_19670 [Betaproteobacteria bacterium]